LTITGALVVKSVASPAIPVGVGAPEPAMAKRPAIGAGCSGKVTAGA
jgi:hypothetical protein